MTWYQIAQWMFYMSGTFAFSAVTFYVVKGYTIKK